MLQEQTHRSELEVNKIWRRVVGEKDYQRNEDDIDGIARQSGVDCVQRQHVAAGTA